MRKKEIEMDRERKRGVKEIKRNKESEKRKGGGRKG